jgi:DNA modification methylase
MAIAEIELNNKQKTKLNLIKPMDGTFKNNFDIPIHRWYPYIEGFSINFVKSILDNYDSNIIVYDPFNGSGTTTLTASSMGIKSYAAEVNPFMRFIANTKVNIVKNIIENNDILILNKTFKELCDKLLDNDYRKKILKKCNTINTCYAQKDFFDKEVIRDISYIKYLIKNINNSNIKDIALLSLASITVEVSNMIRAADLRKKTINEKKSVQNNVINLFIQKLSNVILDIHSVKNIKFESTEFISSNAKSINEKYFNMVDLVITSPPYVNGTNYFRNTKLELWILDFISEETDLKKYREQAITAGINNVSINNKINQLDIVEPYAKQLDKLSTDKRIPKMIRAYFSDMDIVFKNFNLLLRNNGRIYFDIGDSEYYGVHIPVDELIISIAKTNGFDLVDCKQLRKRHSKTGNTLCQKLLIFDKEQDAKTAL